MLAAVNVGEAHGVDATAPALLRQTNNTVVWLRPSSVVAKVATRADAKLDLRLEHAVGKELAALGADIATPLPGAEPVEHAATGFVVTLWERLEGLNGDVPGRSLSKSLAALHAALAKTRTNLPSFLRSVYDSGLAGLEGLGLDRQRLHGEPHDGNRLLTAQGLRWIDFESCCVGPLEWDFAFQSAEVSAAFPNVDADLLRRLRRLNSARVATWCWGQARFPEMRRHGELHLHLLQEEGNRT